MTKAKFKIPRKLKKKLKDIWLYPPDEKGNRLAAWPSKSKKDFEAYKAGKLEKLFKPLSKQERKEYRRKINQPIEISNDDLKGAINEMFAITYRNSSYNILTRAKKSKKAITAYYNFVNAYQLYQNGDDSYGNVCCMAVDRAKELLKS